MKPLFLKKSVYFALGALMALTFSDLALGETEYQKATGGTLCFGEGCRIKILLEEANLGSGELEMAEMTFPSGYEGGGHPHTSIEIFYVLSGQFGHEVNGEFHLLTPGMVGIVKPGDTVRHSVPGLESAKVLVLWFPGGEIDRIFDRKRATPVE